jgi:divalent metal cation (Fe/Co/Zn/Cd) transporter
LSTPELPLATLPLVAPAPVGGEQRAGLVRRAKLLAWLGVGWHGIEAVVAIAAGLAASSIALVGFGADSLIESLAGFVLLWRFAASRSSSEGAERRAQQLIAVSFFVLAAYVGAEAIRTLIGADRPDVSWIGIGLSAFTLVTMPPLAIAKGRVGDQLGSAATRSEGRQNMVCAYLSAALLVGLGANAAMGWWWADPLAALAVAAVAVREGRQTWAGDGCCAVPLSPDACEDECCA